MSDATSSSGSIGRAWRVVRTLLGVKLAYGLVVGGIVWWGEGFDAERAERIRLGWFPAEAPPPQHGRWERHFATWDAEHYLYLSTHGYGPDVRSIAFYPLWPLMLRAATPLAGGNPIIAGLVLANLFSLAGWVVFHRAAARRFDEAAADWALALLLAFPGALFFQFIYSEPLFFLLVSGLWWGLERRRWDVAGLAGFLLPLTRGVGVFAVLPIGWLVLVSRQWRFFQTRAGRRERPGVPWALLAAPLLGWAIYLALMWHWTGHPWAGVEAQKYWGVHALSNLWNVPKFVKGFFDVTAGHEFTGSMLDRLGFVLVLYALPVLWRHGRDLLAWTLMLAVIPAMSGTFTSFVRFESCAFPVFLAAGVWLTEGLGWRNTPQAAGEAAAISSIFPAPSALLRGFGWGLLAVFAGVHLHLLWRFLNYHWAG